MLEVRALELLCSRLCHDLVSPIGAINNGVELMEEMGREMMTDAMALVSQSGHRAAALLRLFRLAYGAAGAQPSFGLAETREVAEAYMAATKTELNWQVGPAEPADTLPPGTAKTLLNALVLAEETLTHGGTITVSVDGGGQPGSIAITASGRVASLSDEAAAALAGRTPAEELTPRSVHAYATGLFARHYNIPLTLDQDGEGQLKVTLRLPF